MSETIDPKGNEMRGLNERAYSWDGQTVGIRIEECIRLLRLHGFITKAMSAQAWRKLQKIRAKAKVSDGD